MVELMRVDEIRRLDAELEARGAAQHTDAILKPGVVSPGGVAVSGHDGFLFIGDGANRWERQYLGELTIVPSWTEAWRALFVRRQAEAAARGVSLWNFIIPEKQVIYPEKRWGETVPAADRRPLKQLMAGLDGAAAQIAYPEEALLAAKTSAPAYFRRNSHWTASGCCAAVEMLLSAMEVRVAIGDVAFAVERNHAPHDLSVHFFSTPPAEEFVLLAAAGEVTDHNRQLELTGRHQGSSYVVRNPAAPDGRKVIVFGDSYGLDMGFTAALSAVFAQVVFVWSKAVLWDLVGRHASQLVLWQSAERYLATMPEA